MICKDCRNKPIVRGIKSVKCFRCGDQTTVNCAYQNICIDCSDKFNVCQYCGESTVKTLWIDDLSDRDKKILKIASNAIYFNDNSDYLSALWEVVNEISNNLIEDCDSELFDLLNND